MTKYCKDCGKETKGFSLRCRSCAQIGKHHSSKTKIKVSIALSGKNNPMFGKHHTKKTKNKIKKKMTGNQNTKNKRWNLDENQKGKNSKCWKGGSDMSRKRREEHRRGYGFTRIGLKIPGCIDHHLTTELITSVAPLVHKKCYHNGPTTKIEGVIG